MIHLEANGARIPALGLGTWRLAGDECRAIVTRALEDGYRHVDTAIMYENEREVGDALRTTGVARDDIFLTTKVWPENVTRARFADEVRASLDRLQVDRVDLLLIHWPPHTDGEAVWAELLDRAMEEGWTRHIGVSNFTSKQLDAMAGALSNKLVCNQVENHPYLDQSIVREACRKHGMALIAYCPLFRGGDLFDEPAVTLAAEAHGKSPAQIVLRWHLQHAGAGAIPKTATPDRLAENKDIFDFELAEAEMAAISALSSRHERICDFAFSPVWDAA